MTDAAPAEEPVLTLDYTPRLAAVRMRMSVQRDDGTWEPEALYELRVCDDCGTAVIAEDMHRSFHSRTEPQPDY